jgi:poly-beta-1,6-N-acetyl-D-glucosamine synthase
MASRERSHSAPEPGSKGSSVDPSGAPPRKLRVSGVVCAYNEERNLPRLLEALLASQGPSFELIQVVCVASGCTDRTVEIIVDFQRSDPRVELIVQPERLGRAAALAAGLRAVRGEVTLVENADTLPSSQALEQLVRPLGDPAVSLVCSHLVPAPAPRAMGDQLGRVVWEIHDYVSMFQPKAGEAFALRSVRSNIPHDVEDDDNYLGFESTAGGGRSVYARDAIVYNRVPQTLRELARQRFRVNRQEISLWRRTHLRASTWTLSALVPSLLAYVRQQPRRTPQLIQLALLEAEIRGMALLGALAARARLVQWTPLDSTKLAIDQAPP